MASREIVGTISIVKEVKVPKENQTTLLQTKKITEMPQGLKRRHPIYGNDLEGIILQSSGLKVPKKEITEPNEFESSNKEKKKKKKKNKH